MTIPGQDRDNPGNPANPANGEKPKLDEILYPESYPNVLRNRGQNNMAKRSHFGGVTRTRVSSQAQKQRWAKNEDPGQDPGQDPGPEQQD